MTNETDQEFEKYPALCAAIEDMANCGLNLINWNTLLAEINTALKDARLLASAKPLVTDEAICLNGIWYDRRKAADAALPKGVMLAEEMAQELMDEYTHPNSPGNDYRRKNLTEMIRQRDDQLLAKPLVTDDAIERAARALAGLYHDERFVEGEWSMEGRQDYIDKLAMIAFKTEAQQVLEAAFPDHKGGA